MYKKTNLIIKCQEFTIRDYSLDKFNHRSGLQIENYFDLIHDETIWFLPGTKIYVHLPNDPVKSIKKLRPESGIFQVLVHPKAIGSKSTQPQFMQVEIPYTNWCFPGPQIKFPVCSYKEKLMVDPFKTKTMMENRGLPKLILKTEELKRKREIVEHIELLEYLGLEETPQFIDISNLASLL